MNNKAFRYRIYPDREQEILFRKTFGCTRFVWNRMLSERNEGKPAEYPAHYKKEFEWLREVDSLALCNVQLQLTRAFADFCRGKSEHPKFKTKHFAKKSYTTNVVNGNIVLSDKFIRLPKLGRVRARVHRHAPETWRMKSVTVTEEAGGKYYASVLYEYESQVSEHTDVKKSIGLDYAAGSLYVDSDGNSASMPRYLKKAQGRLKKMQRKLSKKSVKGKRIQSKRYYRLKEQIARQHEKVRHQRRDFLHKKSRELVNAYDYIGIEDLDTKEMAKVYGKSVSENGWGMFTGMLAYKADEEGKHIIKADRYFPSSQMCHACGTLNPAVRDVCIRRWICPVCGAEHDRDHNAAINLKKEAIRKTLQ